jgi:hypothetical protein
LKPALEKTVKPLIKPALFPYNCPAGPLDFGTNPIILYFIKKVKYKIKKTYKIRGVLP